MSILALHGFTGCGADFAPLAKLCGGEWHCPDLPGHGSEPELDCSPQAMVEFIDKERDKLGSSSRRIKEIAETPKVLLGYSMGARAALLHATRYPQLWDALILISGNPGIEDETARAKRREADAKLADSIEQKGVPAFLDFWQQTPLICSQQNIPSDLKNIMQANRLKHKATALANSLRQFGQGSVPNLWPEVSKLHIPVCLITGTLDTKYTQIAKRLVPILHSAHSTHAVIEGGSHAPHLESVEASASVIQDFLK